MKADNSNNTETDINEGQTLSASETGNAKKSPISHLLDFIHGLDSEFPLSGGETNEELHANSAYIEHKLEAVIKDVDLNYPLSGGSL